jgi:hypothetical protein
VYAPEGWPLLCTSCVATLSLRDPCRSHGTFLTADVQKQQARRVAGLSAAYARSKRPRAELLTASTARLVALVGGQGAKMQTIWHRVGIY